MTSRPIQFHRTAKERRLCMKLTRSVITGTCDTTSNELYKFIFYDNDKMVYRMSERERMSECTSSN